MKDILTQLRKLNFLKFSVFSKENHYLLKNTLQFKIKTNAKNRSNTEAKNGNENLGKNTIFDSKKPSKMTSKIYKNRCKKQHEKTYRKRAQKITRGEFLVDVTDERGGEGFTPYIRMGLPE